MKKGFVTVYMLIVLLVVSLAITFLYEQNQKTSEYTNDIYNKKQAMYLAESSMNVFLNENFDKIAETILKDYDDKNKIDETRALYTDFKALINDENRTIKLTYIARKNQDGSVYNQDLHGLYMLFIKDGVRVGDSKADCEVYFRVEDIKEGQYRYDKNRIKIVIKNSF